MNQVVDDVGGRLPNKFPTQGDPIASGICLDSGQGGHMIHWSEEQEYEMQTEKCKPVTGEENKWDTVYAPELLLRVERGEHDVADPEEAMADGRRSRLRACRLA